MTTIDQFSLAAVPIEQIFNGQIFSHATAFVWKNGNNHFLITNWHVVSGRNSETGENLDHGRRPDMLNARFNLRAPNFGKREIAITIRDGDDHPLWFVHPVRGHGVDVVAIPLLYDGNEPDFNMYPINSLATESVALLVGMDVFILGYPFGVAPPALPVWKRGSVASEPDLAHLGVGRLLVDTSSRKGMSGSPVVRRRWTVGQLGGPEVEGQPLTTLIGVYSGRLHTNNPDDAQIGIVWPVSFIDEIIDGRKRDE
jgi:hypothetical protein